MLDANTAVSLNLTYCQDLISFSFHALYFTCLFTYFVRGKKLHFLVSEKLLFNYFNTKLETNNLFNDELIQTNILKILFLTDFEKIGYNCLRYRMFIKTLYVLLDIHTRKYIL